MSGQVALAQRALTAYVVKVLDGCWFNDHYWAYTASATDMGLDISVTDTLTGDVRPYTKSPRAPAPAFSEAAASPNSCHAAPHSAAPPSTASPSMISTSRSSGPAPMPSRTSRADDGRGRRSAPSRAGRSSRLIVSSMSSVGVRG